MHLIKISLKFFIGHLVVLFIFTIILISFLDAVIGEVDLWLEVVDIELIGGCADVAVLVPVSYTHLTLPTILLV